MSEILNNKDPYENFQKTKFQYEMINFSEIRPHDPWLIDLTSIFRAISPCKNRAVVEDCCRKPGVVSSNLTKTLSFHLEIWFFEIFHRVPYYVGFRTKWIMIPQGTYYNAVMEFPMSF